MNPRSTPTEKDSEKLSSEIPSETQSQHISTLHSDCMTLSHSVKDLLTLKIIVKEVIDKF